jgi:transposase
MKVRCGQMKATEAAAMLGVSRKTYYKWEKRGLEGLFAGLEEKTAGRPEAEAQNTAELERRLAQVQRDNELLQKKMQLKDLVHQMQLKPQQDGAKKK